jgi:hypothetical protein
MLPSVIRGKHRRLQEQLSAYLDDELLPAERLQIERHLDDCAACRSDLEELRTVGWAIGQLREPRTPRSFALEPALFAPAAPVVSAFGSGVASRGRSALYIAAWAAAGLAALALGAGAARFLTRIGEPGPAQTVTGSNLPAATTPAPVSTPISTPVPSPSAPPTATASATPTTGPTATGIVASNVPAPAAAPSRPPPDVLGGNSQPGGSVVIAVPQRPGAPPVSATNAPQPVGTLPSGVVVAPSTLANPGQVPITPTPTSTPGPAIAGAQPVPVPAIGAAPGSSRPPAVSNSAAGVSAPTTAGPVPGVISAGPGQGVSGPAPSIAGSSAPFTGAAPAFTGAGAATSGNVLVPPINPSLGSAARPAPGTPTPNLPLPSP